MGAKNISDFNGSHDWRVERKSMQVLPGIRRVVG